jgi:hypothetical protein
MPRPNPLEAWDELLRDAISSDEDEQENALFLIGLILERHHRPNADAPDLYESHLSRELLRLVLADNRQQAAVIYLAKLVETQPDASSSALYALRRAKPAFFIEPLLELLAKHGKSLNPDAAYEACEALIASAKQPPANLKEALAANDPTDLLDHWAEIGDEDLADRADWAWQKLSSYLPNADEDSVE